MHMIVCKTCACERRECLCVYVCICVPQCELLEVTDTSLSPRTWKANVGEQVSVIVML